MALRVRRPENDLPRHALNGLFDRVSFGLSFVDEYGQFHLAETLASEREQKATPPS